MDTYWARAARTGQLPPGMSVIENTLSQAGRSSEPGAMQTVVVGGGGAYGRPGARGGSQLDALLKRTAELQKAANDANQARYDEGRELLGLEAPDAWHKAGFGSKDAYEAHKARLAGEAAATTPPALFSGNSVGGGNVAGVAATGGNITPQALASRVQAAQRGIYNSSTALNREAVTNSLALQDADRSQRALQMQERQLADSSRRADQAAADQLRSQRLEWIYNRNDAQPNLDRLMQIAAKEGEGNTEGMQSPMAGGGGGGQGFGRGAYGGAAGGYGLPMYGGGGGGGAPMSYEQFADQQRKEANRQESYRVSRGRKAEAAARRNPLALPDPPLPTQSRPERIQRLPEVVPQLNLPIPSPFEHVNTLARGYPNAAPRGITTIRGMARDLGVPGPVVYRSPYAGVPSYFNRG
jgi:hypothetical protein